MTFYVNVIRTYNNYVIQCLILYYLQSFAFCKLTFTQKRPISAPLLCANDGTQCTPAKPAYWSYIYVIV